MTKKLILTTFLVLFSYQARAAVEHDLLDEKLAPATEIKDVKVEESSAKSFFTEIPEVIKNVFSKEVPKSNITTYQYNPTISYQVNLQSSVATVINLPENEKITFYSAGDNTRFNIIYNKELPNLLNIITNSNDSETNLVVKTDVGTIYNFYLTSRLQKDSEKPNFTIYVIKDKDQEEMVKDKILLRDLQENNDYIKKIKSLDRLNTSYKIKGDKEIAPIFVYDDGKWTYFDFGKNFVSDRLPNAYKIVDEFDAVVNTRINGNLVIAQSLSVEGWTLKNGDKFVCIRPKKSLYEVYGDERFKQ